LLALGAGGFWPALLGHEHPAWLHGTGATAGFAIALLGMTATLVRGNRAPATRGAPVATATNPAPLEVLEAPDGS
jgi:hypothetical protein